MSTTLARTVEDALVALAALRERGEVIEDEWQYVTDLEAAWAARLGEVASARGDEILGVDAVAAVARLAEEAAAVADPHRAIDWLSTFPQAVLAALGEAG